MLFFFIESLSWLDVLYYNNMKLLCSQSVESGLGSYMYSESSGAEWLVLHGNETQCIDYGHYRLETGMKLISKLWPWGIIVSEHARTRLSYFSRSQSVQWDWFRSPCLCNRWQKNGWCRFSYKVHICPPLPIHLPSSNNPAGPDFNQNLNLTWPDVFPMIPCTSGPCFSNYFQCLPLLESLLKFISCLPFLNCAANPASWSFQYLISPISRFQNLVHTSIISFFEPTSPQTASHALIAPTAIFSHPSCTACNSITIQIMAQCRNAELRTRSIMLMKLTYVTQAKEHSACWTDS